VYIVTVPDERGSSSDGEDFQSDGESSSDENHDDNNSSLSDNESSRSGSPTPCNSPQSTLARNSKQNSSARKSGKNLNPGGSCNPKPHQSQQQQQVQLQQALALVALDAHNTPSGTLTRKNIMDKGDSGKGLAIDKPRYLTLQLLKNSSNLGICLVGGNVVGIFVHSVQSDSIADRAGLRYIILLFN